MFLISILLMSFQGAMAEPMTLGAHQIRPCTFWQNSVNGWVCSMLPTSIQVADGFETDRAIRDLNDKNRRLEARVAQLEGLLEQLLENMDVTRRQD